MELRGSIKISVRDLVASVLQSGDLGAGFAGSTRMTEAIRGHQAVQKSSGEDYLPEVPVSYSMQRNGMDLEIKGRIDGIINTTDGIIIDEIKTTAEDLENIYEGYNPLHIAQAKCYAYIYGVENDIGNIGIQLTYYQINTKETKRFLSHFTIKELEAFFFDLIDRYLVWARVIMEWVPVRDASIKSMDFPFASYRKGQREFAVRVYKTIRDGNKLFAQAPTGTGKTIAALFPAVKALAEGLAAKIFYLTAKTTARTAAEKALDRMREEGLRLKTLTLTAKEKICFSSGSMCEPEECEYAKGYYDKVKDAVLDIYRFDSFTRPVIEEYARKHRVCPFEFSLDLSLWCDCIICDYNYAFDPAVYLKRFFLENKGDYCFLMDEAHNLVDRCREMFSAEMHKSSVLDLRRAMKNEDAGVYRSLKDINNFMISLRKKLEEDNENHFVDIKEPEEIYPLLMSFIEASEEYLFKNNGSPVREQLLDLYFEAAAFLRASEYYDERYVTYFEKVGHDIRLKIFCLDPSNNMKKLLKRAKSSIFFSATFTPMEYFMEMLGGDERSLSMSLPSPFPEENLYILVDDVTSTRYRVREHSYDRVADSIFTFIQGKTGNYIVYFPSYKYMDEVYTRFVEKNPLIRTLCQKPGMSEDERDEFLLQFSPENFETLVGFGVMGGVFGEGIDLTGDRLSGAVIVGVGLPQISLERDIIRNYFDELKGAGFEYSYIYPGMNRVMQAVGRVIRTETDRGVVLLIDERFSYPVYRKLFPREWHPVRIKKLAFAAKAIDEFWNKS